MVAIAPRSNTSPRAAHWSLLARISVAVVDSMGRNVCTHGDVYWSWCMATRPTEPKPAPASRCLGAVGRAGAHAPPRRAAAEGGSGTRGFPRADPDAPYTSVLSTLKSGEPQPVAGSHPVVALKPGQRPAGLEPSVMSLKA